MFLAFRFGRERISCSFSSSFDSSSDLPVLRPLSFSMSSVIYPWLPEAHCPSHSDLLCSFLFFSFLILFSSLFRFLVTAHVVLLGWLLLDIEFKTVKRMHLFPGSYIILGWSDLEVSESTFTRWLFPWVMSWHLDSVLIPWHSFCFLFLVLSLSVADRLLRSGQKWYTRISFFAFMDELKPRGWNQFAYLQDCIRATRAVS